MLPKIALDKACLPPMVLTLTVHTAIHPNLNGSLLVYVGQLQVINGMEMRSCPAVMDDGDKNHLPGHLFTSKRTRGSK